ncbi:MAG: hypothetical protein INH37_14850 [Myxococcaceae bacterium]|nr:hypothetical protein [Myxococcaceae bacterium]
MIGFCGAPGSGKSEACRVLGEQRGALEVDSAYPMRCFAIMHLGASQVDVWTQEGKRRPSTIPGLSWRQVLGEMGAALETIDPDILVRMALQRCTGAEIYANSSIRRGNGKLWREAGGLVVEIVRPGHTIVNEFDRYDPAFITHRIVNDGTREAFAEKVLALLD